MGTRTEEVKMALKERVALRLELTLAVWCLTSDKGPIGINSIDMAPGLIGVVAS